MSPEGRAVLVTGASRGIGRSCVLALAARGYRVYAAARGEQDPAALASAGDVVPLQMDVTRRADVLACAEAVAAGLPPGGLHGVVSNAGEMLSGPLEHVDVDAFRSHLEVNVVGTLHVVQAFAPLLRASSGRLVLIGSTAGRVGGRFVGPYAASKAAQDRLAWTLRLELADDGVRVSVVDPGVVATGLWDREVQAQDAWSAALPDQARRVFGERLARRRAKLAGLGATGLSPDRVAAVVLQALLSPRPRPRYLVGRDARQVTALARALPERALVRLMT